MKMLILLMLGAFMNFNTPAPLAAGGEAPDITMKNLKGEEVKLSSLRGNIVLVDFWASWCRPCRAKHPGLVQVYNEFHGETFASADDFMIYSVSLDTEKEKWLKAIVDDKLIWPHHVSDLKGWDSAAVTAYGLKGIPANILLDENGVIIGGGYAEASLRDALTKLQ
jgi:thiol-disulfide isomerase/thioredoxin